MYASFLGISEALHLAIFHQPLRNWFFDSLNAVIPYGALLPGCDFLLYCLGQEWKSGPKNLQITAFGPKAMIRELNIAHEMEGVR